uniref:Retrovirus-related Pol polyprotein from transposon TNT 1-94 n=1 Tax=Tanacetum cinerariifolium TaxID=118510 RepID=A0A6L2J3N2_TANCI|nr:retrovirus-related Pol polyprotein from transposon TNT 1-94 [Tanacetum cinerariifolium]
MLPFKMAGLLINKFKGDRVRVLLVQELREMLQALREILLHVKQGLLSVRIIKVLDEEKLIFLADPRVADVQVTQTIIPLNVVFHTDDLDAYDSDCDDISSTKGVFMANLSSYDSNVLCEELVKHARALRPLDIDLDSACSPNCSLVFGFRMLQAYYRKPLSAHQLCSQISWKPNLSYLHVIGALCYPTNDSEDLGKLKPKADIGIFVGYAPAKKAYRIYNKRTRLIIETIYIDFDELTTMASEQFIPMAAAPRLADQTGTPSSTIIDQDAPSPNNDPLFGVLIPEPNSEESSSRDVIPTNVHLINQLPEHLRKWTKDHPLDIVNRNPLKPVST